MIQYPLECELQVHITDGSMTGSVSYRVPLHRLPTEADMPDILKQVKSALPDGFRLMSRHESTMHFLRETKHYRGPNLALPKLERGVQWHDPSAADTLSDLGNEPEEDADA